MSSSPRVSVLMAVYNAARYIDEAIESLLNQSYADFELVIIDDGSKDRSLHRIKRLAARDKRIRWTSRPNRGIGPTRVELAGLAKGEYWAIMDADDISPPERLERQVRFLDEHPECVAVGLQIQHIDPYGLPVNRLQRAEEHETILEMLLRGNGASVLQPTAMLRGGAYKRVGGYDPSLNIVEDLDLFLRLAEVGRLANLPDVWYQYRFHLESITATVPDHVVTDCDRIVLGAHERMGLPPPEEKPWREYQGKGQPGVRARQWGWNALDMGRPDIAWRHALTAIKFEPGNRLSWGLLKRALIALFVGKKTAPTARHEEK